MLDLNVSAYIIKGVVIALHAQFLWYYFFSLKDPVCYIFIDRWFERVGKKEKWVCKKRSAANASKVFLSSAFETLFMFHQR